MFNKIVLIAITAALANANSATGYHGLSQTSVDGTQWKKCGQEWGKGRAGQCQCVGKVKYGAKGKFFYKNQNGMKACNNKNYGDPIGGVVKACFCQKKIAPKPKIKKQKTATYADASFLDSMSAFGEAEDRMAQWQAKHMALVAARFKKAHIYFSEVRKEIAARKLEARWKRDWLAAVKAHDAAIKAHKFSWKAMKASLAKKIAADKHHKLSVAALVKATKERTAALKAWKHAKEIHAAANKAMQKAVKVHARAEKAMNHARKVFKDADVVMTKTEKTAAAAHKAHQAAVKAHKKSVKAQGASNKHERKMARARSAAFKGHQGSIKAHKAAIKSKSDAYANAVKASRAVRKHTMANGMFAL